MAKVINEITEASCRNLSPAWLKDDKPFCVSIDELSERCKKASEVYGPVFHEYLVEKYKEDKDADRK